MNLLGRLLLVTLLVCSGFGALYAIVYIQGRAEVHALMDDLGRERAARLDAATTIQGAGLEALVSSYAWWGEMVAFMDKPDPQWAANNVDNVVGIPGGGDAVWVCDPAFTVLHAIDKDYRRPAAPFARPELVQQAAAGRYTFRYFTLIDGELWEIFVAAIQDAKFWRHQTPIRGHLLIGKRWDHTWVAQLGTVLGGRIAIHPLDRPPAERVRLHDFRRELKGLGGQPLALLDVNFNFELLEAARQSFIRRVDLVSVGTVFAIALLVGGVAFLVLRPLGQITRSLETRQTAPMAGLLSSRTEFGEIARLLAGQFRWGQMLQDEMRRQLERSDPAQLHREAESNETLRLRLAGDIHDGPVQSIYAAGLQLAAVQEQAEQGQSPAPEQIQQITAMLQQASSDLRNLILDLEPEELRERDLEAALQRIERHLEQFARCRFTLTVADGALDGLSRDAQTELYFICRELTSNALRHARPATASLRFTLARGFLRLAWENDGVTPRQSGAGGNGLRNIARRIQDLGGTVEHGPHGADRWRVTCEIPCTSLREIPPRPRRLD